MLRICLAGDVMLGRGIDQVMPHPCDPQLHERHVTTALTYVSLAEEVSGPIPRGVPPEYVWGDALEVLDEARPDVRIVNLETAITAGGAPEPRGINYRMNPRHVGALAAARIDCCVLANNHVLDWGIVGLRDTLEALQARHIMVVGAGLDDTSAAAPAILAAPGQPRVIVVACATESSGVPPSWRASAGRPGIDFVELDIRTVEAVGARAAAIRRPGDIVVLSIHWGENWVRRVPAAHVDFAHALIDQAGVDIVHGHSSHHPLALEVYRGRPILYGCGDLINDYEGIGGYSAWRPELVALYLVDADTTTGTPNLELRILPLRIRRFRLERVAPADARWMRDAISHRSEGFGTVLDLDDDGFLRTAGSSPVERGRSR